MLRLILCQEVRKQRTFFGRTYIFGVLARSYIILIISNTNNFHPFVRLQLFLFITSNLQRCIKVTNNSNLYDSSVPNINTPI